MNVLIVGFGSIGKRHYQLLKENDDVPLVHIISCYGESDDIIASSLDCLKDEVLSRYDIFFICSETAKHYQQLLFIDKRVEKKLIIVEKPLFNTFCDYTPRNKVCVAYNLRFHPVIQGLTKLVEKEQLLSLYVSAGQYLPDWRPGQNYMDSYSCSLERGGGVVRDLSHEIDYAEMFCGSLTLISAYATSNSHLKIQADDICSILATNQNKVHIVIQVDYLSYKAKREIKIQTDDKTIYADLISGTVEVYFLDGNRDILNFDVSERNYTYLKMHENIINDAASHLTNYISAKNTVSLITEITNNYMEKPWN